MKKLLFLITLLCLSSVLIAALPVTETFAGGTIVNTWEQFWTVDSTLTAVPNGTDGKTTPAADGYFGKDECVAAAATTSGKITGDFTDTSYTVEAYLYTPVYNTGTGFEAYHYQMLVFYRDSGGYGRLHTHFNETPLGTPPSPRIRCQITNPGFVYTAAWTSPTNFTHSEGWHIFKIEITGTVANCYYDTTLLGVADWTLTAATRTAGKFGFGQYMDDVGTGDLYVDEFKAYVPVPTSIKGDWTAYE